MLRDVVQDEGGMWVARCRSSGSGGERNERITIGVRC